MIVYKGTNKDMICTYGKGKFQYVLGEKITEKECKARKNGLHACYYVLDCIQWYSLKDGRYFLCEAGEGIDEEGGSDKNTIITCKELTLLSELSLTGIVHEAILYMLLHPGLSQAGWERQGRMLEVKKDYAEANCAGAIAIARGRSPRVKTVAGAAVGLIWENEKGEIDASRLQYFIAESDGVYMLETGREAEE